VETLEDEDRRRVKTHEI